MDGWLRRLLIICCMGPALTAWADLPEPAVEWKLDAGAGLEATPVPYPSGRPDSVVIGTGGRLLRVDGRGKVIFRTPVGPEAGRGGVFDASVADLDGDGREEIVGGHNDGYVCALDGEGKVLWTYELGERLGTWQMANPVDLDGDGRAEVLVSDLGGWVTCLSPDGKLRWRTKMADDVWEVSTPAAGDLDGDGAAEVVYGTQTRYVVCLDAEGRFRWERFVPPLHLGRTMPLIADNDGDGIGEVYAMSSMLAKDGGVVCLDGRDGSVRWTGATDTNVYHGRCLARFDDGTRGVIVADKANCVTAFQADGTRRWRVDLSGRGVWTPPAVADIDGDGRLEAIVTVRDGATDGSGKTWYVLDASTGEPRGGFAAEGGFGGPCVADIDGDGALEIVIGSRPGILTCYSFGGAPQGDAVVSASWRDGSHAAATKPADAPAAPAMPLLESLPEPGYGNNPLEIAMKEGPARALVEVRTQSPDGTRETRCYRAPDGASTLAAVWPVLIPGSYAIDVRVIDRETGLASGGSSVTRVVGGLAGAIGRDSLDEALAIRERLAKRSPEAAAGPAAHCAEAEARLSAVAARVEGASALSDIGRRRLGANVEELRRFLGHTRALARLTESEVGAGRAPSFVLWPDDNPWDNTDPLDTLPAQAPDAVVRTWAFGNEVESVGVNAANLGARGLTLRVGRCEITRDGQPVAAPDAARLHRAVWLPSQLGEKVPDVLPRLADGGLLDVAPGEAQQLWINLNTRGLAPGTYELKWPVTPLEAGAQPVTLTVALEVSPVALPEKSRYLACFWSRNRIDGVSTAPDLNEHLQTVWYGLPLPGAKCDANGELAGELDWTEHDAVVREARQIELILYGAPPTPAFPEGVQPTEELRLRAQRNYAQKMVEHLQSLGIGYDRFMFYPEDEPGLTGSIAHYMERARANKAVDPTFQNYGNPWGAVDLAKLEEMWPVTDVWQPGMDVIEQLGPESVAAMRRGGKRVLTYTPPGNCRVLRPLGFFRAQPWIALHWGIDGGGWWTYYQQDDLLAVEPEPSYGAVTWDGRSIIPSRRWEASRDGIEDFNAVTLLRERAAARGDAAALDAAQAAIDYAARTALTGMPREAAPYDLDYDILRSHRVNIRAALERLQPQPE